MNGKVPEWIMALTSVAGLGLAMYSLTIANQALERSEAVLDLERARSQVEMLDQIEIELEDFEESLARAQNDIDCTGYYTSELAGICEFSRYNIFYQNMRTKFPVFFDEELADRYEQLGNLQREFSQFGPDYQETAFGTEAWIEFDERYGQLTHNLPNDLRQILAERRRGAQSVTGPSSQ